MQRSPRWLAAALLVLLTAAACGDLPTARPAAETAQLGFALDLSATDVSSVSVQVTAADISQPLVYNMTVTNGTVSGRIDVPAGTARTLTVRAYDNDGVQTHEGSTTVDVRRGNNPPVTVTLVPRAGELPISVNFGSVLMRINQLTYPNQSNGYSIGSMANFEAVVTSPDGTPIPGAVVRWASLDPTVMGVSQTGTGYATAVGTTEIVATWNGYGTSIRVHVAGSGPDYLPPQLNGLAFDKPIVRYTGTPQTVTLEISVTDEVSGIDHVMAHIRSTSYGSVNPCHARPSGTAGLWKCAVTVDASSPLGDFTVEYLDVRDSAGNGTVYSAPQLEQMGMAARFSVVP
ncbi:MAG TPA: hypothetical protein VGC13_18515 [Longimicrobium sp.]|jgi:hypothetical protein|uniref:hypothetical protein n=1 Tax=Longimicrobium sp. TaxID=2029185 RepID=UPI002ED7A44D